MTTNSKSATFVYKVVKVTHADFVHWRRVLTDGGGQVWRCTTVAGTECWLDPGIPEQTLVGEVCQLHYSAALGTVSVTMSLPGLHLPADELQRLADTNQLRVYPLDSRRFIVDISRPPAPNPIPKPTTTPRSTPAEVDYTAAEVRALRYVREQLTRRLKVYEDFPGALRDFMTRRNMTEEQAADFFAVTLADFRRLLSGKLSPVLGAPVIARLRRNL